MDLTTLCHSFERLHGGTERQLFESQWQTISELVNPTTDFTRRRTPGEERRNKMYDTTAPEAAMMLASTLHTLITNPATQWMHLKVADPSVVVDEEGDRWLQNASMALIDFYSSPASGANTTLMETYLNLATFGTGPFVRKPQGPGKLPKYFSIPLSNLFLEGDDTGEIVSVYRLIEYSGLDLVADFGIENVSQKVRDYVSDEKHNRERKFDVVHAVFLANRESPTGDSPFNKPWGSVYFERAEKHELRRGGFDRNPYHTPRWTRQPGEVYGRSPAMAVMPSIKLLNVMTRDTIIAGELMVRPPMMIPANSVEGPIRTAPGSNNYYEMGTRDKPEPMKTGANPAAGMSMIEVTADHVRRGFFNDLMRLPESDRMTALEVQVRSTQKLQVMSPVLSRLLAEGIGPMIASDYDLMLKGGMLPPPPASLNDRTLRVEYRSPMAIAQQASQANNLLQLMGVAAPLIQADPELMREIDGGKTLRALSQAMNATVLHFRDPEVIAAEKQAQAEQAQAESGASTARDLAAAGKDAAATADISASSEGLRLAQ